MEWKDIERKGIGWRERWREEGAIWKERGDRERLPVIERAMVEKNGRWGEREMGRVDGEKTMDYMERWGEGGGWRVIERDGEADRSLSLSYVKGQLSDSEKGFPLFPSSVL